MKYIVLNDIMSKIGDKMILEHNFEPIVNKDSKVLILGSFPSVKSRENNFYYGNDKNRFWRILSEYLSIDLPVTIDDKKKLLISNNIAIWDTIKSCEIKASDDSSIKNVKVNDIYSLISRYNIKNIVFNGNAAYKFYKKYIGNIEGVQEYILPSTSPANARITYDELFKIWEITLKNVLEK